MTKGRGAAAGARGWVLFIGRTAACHGSGVIGVALDNDLSGAQGLPRLPVAKAWSSDLCGATFGRWDAVLEGQEKSQRMRQRPREIPRSIHPRSSTAIMVPGHHPDGVQVIPRQMT